MGLREIADWKHIGTVTILALASVVGSIILFGWQLYWDVETPDTGLKDAFAAHVTVFEGEGQAITDALNNIAKVLGEVRTDQQEAYKRDLTMRGLGAAGSFGGTEKYVRVNSDSEANLYREGDRIRITKIADEGRASEIFEVRGEWTHPDPAVLVSFSQAACEVLEVSGIVKVQLEPVLEK
jgi:hypothetical protein